MLTKSIKILLVNFLLGALVPLFAICPLGVLNPEVNPKPLEYKGVGHVTFSIYEDEGVAVPALDAFGDPTCEFNVDLNLLGNNSPSPWGETL